MLSITEEDDIALDDTEDDILLEDKGDIGLEDEEDEVVIDHKVDRSRDTLQVNVEDKTNIDEETPRDSSDAYCSSDGTNCEKKRSENIYAEVPDPKPLEDIGTPGEDVAIPVEETPKKKSKRTSEENSKADNAERKGKKNSASSPEELEEELRAAYKSTQKKAKVETSHPVNLEGCQKLLDQAQVRTTFTVF